MRDILPPESDAPRRFVDIFADVVEAAGYGQVITPLLEDLGVFSRIGEATDVVQKEMYHFTDNGGRDVALRPEFTASVCRAFVAASAGHTVEGLVRRSELPLREAPARPLSPVRPGRHRGARQRRPLRRRRGDRARLALPRGARAAAGRRCCSTASARPTSGPATSTRCARTSSATPTRCRRRAAATLARNPLRVLDSKRAEDVELIARRADDRRLLRRGGGGALRPPCTPGLDRARHPVHDRPRAWCAASTTTSARRSSSHGGTLDSAQNALGGGGRYDGLVEALGGPPTPGIGFALGVDRTLHRLRRRGRVRAPSTSRRVRGRHHRRPGGARSSATSCAVRGWRSTGRSTAGA